MKDSVIAQCIRAHRRDITSAWRAAVVTERPELSGAAEELTRHLPAFLEQLADSSRGEETPFLEAACEYARARLRAGASLEELTLEYALLRKAVLEQLQGLGPEAGSLDGLVRLNEALDQATELAVRCYDEQRISQGERFVRLLGHDLRNPLNAAAIAAEALTRSESLSDRGQRRLSTISRANARMGRMIENMLDFARSYFGADLPLLVEPGDWGEVCHGAFEELNGEHPGRALALTRRGDLTGSFDRERLRQAALNLLGYALEHGQDPIELVVAPEATDGEESVVTRVTSAGQAAPPVALTRLNPLLEPKGTGGSNSRLGLFVTDLIARAHGATCDVSSTESGWSVTIRWPRHVAARATRDE